MHSTHLLLFCLVVFAAGFITAEVLANSGYPMKGANPQRNYQINKKLLCHEVAPGRTQVWNIAWEIRLDDCRFYNAPLTQDEEGFIYLRGSFGTEGEQSAILKINSTDGTYNPDLIYFSSIINSIPTHVQGNKMYVVKEQQVAVVNTTSMQEIASQDHGVANFGSCSFAPIGDNLMVSSFSSNSIYNLLFYLNTTSFEFETNLPGTSVSAGSANDVIVYKNSNNVEIPIAVYGPYGAPITVWSPNYQFIIDGSHYYTNSFVQGDQLVVVYGTPESNTMVGFYNANTGVSLRNVSLKSWQGSAVTADYPFVVGSKSIAQLSGDFDGQYKPIIVDFLNNKTLFKDASLGSIPFYSIPDNSVLITALTEGAPEVLVSLDWDTYAINAVGSFPSDGQYGDYIMSPPLVGDDCSVYRYFNDFALYPGLLLALKPLPISNVVPIVECINADGVGYFSYNNMEDKRIIIPYVSDRNNLSPLGGAPATDFKANRRGKYFPLSSRFAVNGTIGPLTWQLEDYVVSFSNTAQLRCPQNVTIVLYFNATSTIPSGFSEWIRLTFASFTEITDSRVSVVPTSKRSTMASTFEVRLHIAVISNTEKSPEQAAREFSVRRNILLFNDIIAQDSAASSAGINLIDVDGVPLDTEISGTIPPKAPISSPTTSQPSGNQPSQTPASNTNSPKTGSTSLGVVSATISMFVVAAVALASW